MDFKKLTEEGLAKGCCFICSEHRPLECKSCTTSAILLTVAQNRCMELEQIMLKLKDCYQWDRNEYQSNKALVAAVEEALSATRQVERK